MSTAAELEPLLIGVDDVQRITGLGKTSIYSLIKSRDLRPTKIGAKTVFSYAEVREFAANMLARRDTDEAQAAARSAEATRRRLARTNTTPNNTPWKAS